MESVSEQQVLTIVQMNPWQQAISYKSLAPSLITEKPRLRIQFVAHKENVLQLSLPALVAERLQLLENIPTFAFHILLLFPYEWDFCMDPDSRGWGRVHSAWIQIDRTGSWQTESLGEINTEFCLFVAPGLIMCLKC